jgi:NADH dehydrogenase
VGKVRLKGRIAWIAWLVIHVLALIGFRNRATVFLEWVWNYVFSKRGARLITSNEWRQEPPREERASGRAAG